MLFSQHPWEFGTVTFLYLIEHLPKVKQLESRIAGIWKQSLHYNVSQQKALSKQLNL